MTGDEIRKAFLQFFEGKGHTVIPSSSLVPRDDPTLLLTTAGMVQIKSYFLGLATPPNRRLASCQKCFRTSDIDSVGDNIHLTFFEMLGNFSVGDYFKKEAIEWAWEFVIQWLKLSPERLWITVFLDDDEAFHYWRGIGVPAEKIVRRDEEDNFWGPAGDSGPCGPCSEIHYDFGEEFGCGKPDCGPGCDCPRFSEIWNLVFTQYNQDREGKRMPLPKPNIDTGMGLERTAAIMQGKRSVYETDLFAPIIARVTEIAGKSYGHDEAVDRAIRIVAEHARAVTFLIADGVFPSNEGRGYVLRRVLRRAALFGRKLGLDEPFLNGVANIVVDKMGRLYPELARNQEFILQIIGLEEERFGQTLDTGLNFLNAALGKATEAAQKFALSSTFASRVKQVQKIGQQMQRAMPNQAFLQALQQYQKIAQQMQKTMPNQAFLQALQQYQKIGQQMQKTMPNQAFLQALQETQKFVIPGRETFKLHDTYGFPKELTTEIAAEKGFSVDYEEFEAEMEHQRGRARAAQKVLPREEKVVITEKGMYTPRFVGHKKLKCRARIWHLLVDGKPVKNASEGQEVSVYLDDTPFYAEMGGQVGDTGEIRGPHGTVRVEDTVRSGDGTAMHRGKVVDGTISDGARVTAMVDEKRRLDIARNHTATHLLQAALRQVLGKHVRQSGSLVAPERFRFDFTHPGGISREQVLSIQHIVNEKIRENLRVTARTTSYGEAVSKGAIALFGEKYGDTVRLMEIGDPPFSMELCGGTHVSSTGEIGLMYITSEGSIGSGIRRIEAVTGRGAEGFLEQRLSTLETLAQELDTSPDAVQAKLSAVLAELDKERKRVVALESQMARETAKSLLPSESEREVVGGVTVVRARVPPASPDALRQMGDRLKEQLATSGAIVLGTIYNDKPSFVVMITPDLVAKGFHSGEIVKQVAKAAGGGGGGKAELGQGSGKDIAKLDEALKTVPKLIAAHYDKDSGMWKGTG